MSSSNPLWRAFEWWLKLLPPLVGAVVDAAIFVAAGCDALDTSVSGGGEPREIASGEAGGVPWRLFAMPSSMGEFLCLESVAASAFACSSGFGFGLEMPGAEGSVAGSVLGMPTLAEGEPAFVYGTIGATVARVIVAMESGDPVRAEVVGEGRGYYVAAVPSGGSPTQVVAYDSEDDELARVGFPGDQPDGAWADDAEEWCGPTEDGGYACSGRASIRASDSTTTECRETDEGKMVCERVEE